MQPKGSLAHELVFVHPMRCLLFSFDIACGVLSLSLCHRGLCKPWACWCQFLISVRWPALPRLPVTESILVTGLTLQYPPNVTDIFKECACKGKDGDGVGRLPYAMRGSARYAGRWVALHVESLGRLGKRCELHMQVV